MMNSQGVTGGSLTASNGGSGGSLVEAHKRGGGGGEGVAQQEGAVHVVDSPPPSPMTAAARALEQASITDAAYLVNVALETQHQKRQRQPQPQLPQFQSSVPSIPIDAASYDDDDDDGDPGGETFEDEPVEEVAVESAAFTDNKKKNPVKRGRRLRPKRTVEATSYWSSDDDSSPPLRQTPRAAVTKRKSKNTAASKQQQQQQKKTSLRHVVENEVKELVIDEEESLPHTIQPSPQQQRILPPLLVAAETATTPIASVISDKPPVAVVRTKKSALSPQPISTKRSVAFDSSNSARGNLTPNTNINRYPSPRVSASTTTTAGTFPRLSMEDVEIMQRLDDEYERALEEREVGYMARYASVRQAACLSVVFMLVFLILGTTFYVRYTGNWSVHDSLLFSIYTITTVGYGYHEIPRETGFQCFTILYIFVGIATLTIMVAQVYQCIALEAARAQHSRDKSEMARRGLDVSSQHSSRLPDQQLTQNPSSQESAVSSVSGGGSTGPTVNIFLDELAYIDTIMRYYERAKHFFTYNEYGRSFSVLLPFAGLILIGSIVVGPIEQWNVIESIYFSVVSLTTVGYGDYYPSRVASIWFCILWLPFSIGFMSLFLRNVATFYIRLSAQNISRIERRMRRRLARAKVQFEKERAEALKRAYHGQSRGTELELRQFSSESVSGEDAPESESKATSSLTGSHAPPPPLTTARTANISRTSRCRHGNRRGRNSQNFNSLPAEESSIATPTRASLFGSPGEEFGTMNRRERILKNSLGKNHGDGFRPTGQTMDTMRHVIEAVHRSMASADGESPYLSMRSTKTKLPVGDTGHGPVRKPSFALRAIVQERFAEIIATDIAGFQSSIEIKDNTLSVTIDSLQATADKWCIPRRARRAFRSVAFEVLYFVGERGLITKGANALYALTPFEFHDLFSPLLASMGDADTMESWLARTEVLAEVDLRNKDVEEAAGGEDGDDDDDDDDDDVETGNIEKSSSQKQMARTTAEKLHTATHQFKPDTGASDSIDSMAAGHAFD